MPRFMRNPTPPVRDYRRHFALIAAFATLLTLAWAPWVAMAAETLTEIRARGSLRCGVSEGIEGFSAKDAAGRWAGLDVDFCRAVAAAALGDPEKVTFVPTRASERFPALQLKTVDLLARNTTWTFEREAGLRVHFVGILFYDGQGFMVPAGAPVASVAKLDGGTVCVEKGTTHERNLADYAAANRLRLTPLVIDSSSGVVDALLAGRCGAYTSDGAQLAAARLRARGGQALVILPERISKEPMGPVVRRGDDDWVTLVRGVLFALLTAEERGITRETARAPDSGRGLGRDPDVVRALGLDLDWALRAVRSVGNYGEMFERNLGSGSPLKLERGLNRLWTQGGLMYAPPMR